MAGLFGTAPILNTAESVAQGGHQTGREKRLELDLRPISATGVIDAELITQVATCLGFKPSAPCQTDVGGVACFAADGLVLGTAQRIVVTADMSVSLHGAVKQVLELLLDAGFEVEWASFVRKNTSCPWDARDTTMALEYAALKEAFPNGRPFVFGPVDSHHYFYYVSDSLVRGPSMVESDVQINAKLYNFQCGSESRLGSLAVGGPAAKAVRQSTVIGTDSYETLRVRTTTTGHLTGNMLSFETNADAPTALTHLAAQIVALKPERFTVMMLLDPHSASGRAHAAHAPIGVEQEHFPGYVIANRMSNTFEHGYAVVKVSYLRS